MLVAVSELAPISIARAFESDTGIPDLQLRWDNAAKYTAAARVRDRSQELIVDQNYDNGDRKFKRGTISNRLVCYRKPISVTAISVDASVVLPGTTASI